MCGAVLLVLLVLLKVRAGQAANICSLVYHAIPPASHRFGFPGIKHSTFRHNIFFNQSVNAHHLILIIVHIGM